jgi:hypothetical protein
MYAIRILLATAVAAIAGFAFHVLYGRGLAQDYLAAAGESGRLGHMLQEPYPTYVVTIAALTALIPTLGKVIVWLLIRDKLPGVTTAGKAVWFTGLMLLMSDDFLRMPIMNLLVGMPIDVLTVYSAEQWVIVPMMCFLIAFILPPPRDAPPGSMHPVQM